MKYLTKYLGVCLIATVFNGSALAAKPLNVVVSFSILQDITAQIGGDKVKVLSLVGTDSDAHVYQPRPTDVRSIRNADLLVVNGLGFEGWMTRLGDAAGFTGLTVVATDGVAALESHGHTDDEEDHEAEDHEVEDHEAEDHEAEDHHDGVDPHAWLSIDNAMIYARNISDGLIQLDPENTQYYQTHLKGYLDELAALQQELSTLVIQVPENKRRIITTHDAFHYLEQAFGIEFLSAQGVSTESEPSARDIAQLIRQIRSEDISAVFAENISDDRLIQQIARETGAVVGGTLYSGALSAQDGPAASYVALMRHNISSIVRALAP